MMPCICPVIDRTGRQNVVRTSVTHSAIASCATFLPFKYHILTSSVIYYWTDARQQGTYLLNDQYPMILHLYIISLKILQFLTLFCYSTIASPNLRIVWKTQLNASLNVPLSLQNVYLIKRALFKYPVAAVESWEIVH